MKKRVFRGLFFQSCLIVCLSTVFILGMLYIYFSRITENEIKNHIAYISVGVEKNGLEYLTALEDIDNRITWISNEGKVLFDSEKDIEDMENHSDREEIIEAMENGSGESYRQSSTLGEMSFYYAKKLEDGSVLRVSGTRYTVISLLLGVLAPVSFVLMLSFVLASLISGRVSGNITKPINDIDLSNIDEVDTYEELTPFIRKISHQNKKIQAQFNELQQKQQEFETITENMSEGLLMYDKNTEIVFYNTSALKILGANEVINKQSVYVLNRSESFINAVNASLAGEHSESVITLDDRIYQLISNPVYNDNANVGGIIIMFDITEKEERENLRREFSANVSHELKTPLTSISGFAEIMKSGLVKDEDMKRFAGNIYNEARRMITLVGDVIKLSKFDEGGEATEITDVDMKAVIADNVERLNSVAAEKNVEIVCECENIKIKGYASVIDEMVFNLMENAIKYNKQDGKVFVTLKKKDDMAELVVEDTGIGIPYADQSRVFERFYRVDKSHSKKIGGTGLGLSIVKHGAAMHNASIQLESEPYKGTRIIVKWGL